jgi:hypothetical protein
MVNHTALGMVHVLECWSFLHHDVKENSCILTIGLPKRYINYRYN